MNNLGIKEEFMPQCPIRNVLARVASKWALIVLHTLDEAGTIRFSAIQHKIPDISQKMLTSTLRTLVADGFVVRNVFPEVPPRVEYSLTERAHSFMSCANVLIGWAFDNMGAIMKDRERMGKAS